MKKLHLIMPMGGRGYRFFKDGYSMPKPLIELNGKPFFYWSAQSVMKFVDVADISFVGLQENKGILSAGKDSRHSRSPPRRGHDLP